MKGLTCFQRNTVRYPIDETVGSGTPWLHYKSENTSNSWSQFPRFSESDYATSHKAFPITWHGLQLFKATGSKWHVLMVWTFGISLAPLEWRLRSQGHYIIGANQYRLARDQEKKRLKERGPVVACSLSFPSIKVRSRVKWAHEFLWA